MSNHELNDEKIVRYNGSRVSRKSVKNWIHKARSLGNHAVANAIRSIGDIVLNEKLNRDFQAKQFVAIKEFESERKNRKRSRKASAVEKIQEALAS